MMIILVVLTSVLFLSLPNSSLWVLFSIATISFIIGELVNNLCDVSYEWDIWLESVMFIDSDCA